MSAPENPPLFSKWQGSAWSEISLRDIFAGFALAGACVNEPGVEDSADLASEAYAHADAMLAERAKGQP